MQGHARNQPDPSPYSSPLQELTPSTSPRCISSRPRERPHVLVSLHELHSLRPLGLVHGFSRTVWYRTNSRAELRLLRRGELYINAMRSVDGTVALVGCLAASGIGLAAAFARAVFWRVYSTSWIFAQYGV